VPLQPATERRRYEQREKCFEELHQFAWWGRGPAACDSRAEYLANQIQCIFPWTWWPLGDSSAAYCALQTSAMSPKTAPCPFSAQPSGENWCRKSTR